MTLDRVIERTLGFFICLGLFFVLSIPQIVVGIIIGINQMSKMTKFTGLQTSIGLLVSGLVIAFFVWLANKKGLIDLKKRMVLKKLAIVIFLGQGMIMLTNVISDYLMTLEGVNNTVNQQLIMDMVKQLPVSVIVSLLLFVAAIGEELFFRGFIPHYLFKSKVVGLIVGSLLFTLAHLSTDLHFSSFFVYGGMSAVLGYVVYKTNHVEYSIALHFVNNLIAVIALLLTT